MSDIDVSERSEEVAQWCRQARHELDDIIESINYNAENDNFEELRADAERLATAAARVSDAAATFAAAEWGHFHQINVTRAEK